MKILFLCRGNVGRSTFAKYLFDKLSNGNKSESAGTKPSGVGDTLKEIGADYVIRAMEQEGIDVSGHIRKEVTPEMVKNANIIISMAEPETVPEFVSSHPGFTKWTVDDPKGTDLETHIRIKEEIKSKVKDLMKNQQTPPERKIIKTGTDNSVDGSQKTSELQNKLDHAKIERQKISRLINVFFLGLFIVYLMYLYL
jgi:protein-tyrosine-phosphatase